MNKIYIALSVATLLMVGCSDKPKEQSNTKSEKAPVEVAAPTIAPQNIYGTTSSEPEVSTAPAGADVQTNAPHVAKVLETIDAAGYTYAKVDEGGNIYWIAAPQATIKVGETISYLEQMVMKDFMSKSLNKKFDYLMFASAIIPAGAEHDHSSHAGMPHPTLEKTAPATQVAVEKISVAKLEGGYSVEEIYASKAELKDKKVKLRAKVVKVSKGIMGKDWVHLQDGTGEGATSDIIATTTNSTVKVGDVVITQAILKTDVDLGYGYFFSVILEESTFTN